MFERDGYLDARVADIAAGAGAVYAPAPDPDEPGSGDRAPSPEEAWRRIELGNRRYIRLFHRDRRLLAVFEQVASFDEEMRRYRLELRRRSVARAGEGIRRLQEWKLADADLDPELAAHALSSMVTQYVYYWLVMGQDLDEEASYAR